MHDVLFSCFFVLVFSYVSSSIVTFSVNSSVKKREEREKKVRTLHLLAVSGNIDAEREWQHLKSHSKNLKSK